MQHVDQVKREMEDYMTERQKYEIEKFWSTPNRQEYKSKRETLRLVQQALEAEERRRQDAQLQGVERQDFTNALKRKNLSLFLKVLDIDSKYWIYDLDTLNKNLDSYNLAPKDIDYSNFYSDLQEKALYLENGMFYEFEEKVKNKNNYQLKNTFLLPFYNNLKSIIYNITWTRRNVLLQEYVAAKSEIMKKYPAEERVRVVDQVKARYVELLKADDPANKGLHDRLVHWRDNLSFIRDLLVQWEIYTTVLHMSEHDVTNYAMNYKAQYGNEPSVEFIRHNEKMAKEGLNKAGRENLHKVDKFDLFEENDLDDFGKKIDRKLKELDDANCASDVDTDTESTSGPYSITAYKRKVQELAAAHNNNDHESLPRNSYNPVTHRLLKVPKYLEDAVSSNSNSNSTSANQQSNNGMKGIENSVDESTFTTNREYMLKHLDNLKNHLMKVKKMHQMSNSKHEKDNHESQISILQSQIESIENSDFLSSKHIVNDISLVPAEEREQYIMSCINKYNLRYKKLESNRVFGALNDFDYIKKYALYSFADQKAVDEAINKNKHKKAEYQILLSLIKFETRAYKNNKDVWDAKIIQEIELLIDHIEKIGVSYPEMLADVFNKHSYHYVTECDFE